MRTIDHLAGASTATADPVPDPYGVRRREAVYRAAAARLLDVGAKRVLDLACGDGYGAAILATAGLDVTALDDDPDAIAAADRMWRIGGLRFRTSDARDTREPQRSFDAVVCAWGLERHDDPRPLLTETRRVLRDDGTVILCTPNRLVVAPGRTRPLDPDHAWEYTPDELRRLASWLFEDAAISGLFHRGRLKAIERAIGEPLPIALGRVAPPDRASWLRLGLWGLRATDFRIGPAPLRDAVDLVAVARV